MLFQDRREAGKLLAERLRQFRYNRNAIVLALPRGGVIVGDEIAGALDLPLDVVITRKIGPPGNPEYAIGALAENGELFLNEAEIHSYGIPRSYIDDEVQRQKREIERRVLMYRGGQSLPALKDRIVLLVDDGVATGFTTATAIKAVRRESPRELVLAIPVGPAETLQWLGTMVDQIVCLASPEPFLAVGRFYVHFEQVDDEELCQILDQHKHRERTTETQ